MKHKYLGTFVHGIDFKTLPDTIDDVEDVNYIWTDIDDDDNIIDDEFIRIDSDIFDGSMGETNTSALFIKLNKTDDTAKMWRGY